jgi:hypothetical protein
MKGMKNFSIDHQYNFNTFSKEKEKEKAQKQSNPTLASPYYDYKLEG